MSSLKFACLWVSGMALLFLAPAANAQSSISGTVKDSSGAFMPGVQVEVASPALIEKVRSATTDGNGRFNVIDLRPGEYSVTATAAGFKTYKQDNIDLPAGTAVPVFIEMAVGATSETLTVQAESGRVDVESATHQQVLTREIQDSLPAPRNRSTRDRRTRSTPRARGATCRSISSVLRPQNRA